uniref:Uncharacterized protein n=1 Tax=Calcidiscus leptoporus TaxID=127549 RepID=A0A6U5D4A6_9EUKA
MSSVEGGTMSWNKEPIPVAVALQIGWNLPQDIVGAGVYGGIVKREATGRIINGDEWPENNVAPPAHNPVHAKGPYLDFSKLTRENRGYTLIAQVIMAGHAELLDGLLERAGGSRLANLVMTGGARPLHMCGMSHGANASECIKMLIKHGADVNAKDNYEMTPMDRLSSNSVKGNEILRQHGGKWGRQLPRGVPQWTGNEYAYTGPGETE